MTLYQLEPRFTEFLWKNNKELRWTCRPANTVNMMITDDRLLSHCNGSYGAHSSSIHIKLNEKKRRHKPSIALSILSAARNLVWGQRAVECRSLKYLCTWSMKDHAFRPRRRADQPKKSFFSSYARERVWLLSGIDKKRRPEGEGDREEGGESRIRERVTLFKRVTRTR